MTQETHLMELAESPTGERDELLRAATTAAALIELAIKESLKPVDQLGQALSRIADKSAAVGGTFTADVSVCIENVQFHDRMVQQLTQIRDLLCGAADQRGSQRTGPEWPVVRERLRRHFTSESHRILFDLLMPGEPGKDAVQLHAAEGSLELF